MTATPAPQPKFVEKRSIDYIPASERHGRPVSLFFVWFAANSSITALVTGALMTILGNSALWSIPAIILGNILGGYITALHSAQGPQLGVPQMIQSRAQFGFYGAILPLILALFIYIGFYATGLVLGGQALGLLFHVSPQIGPSSSRSSARSRPSSDTAGSTSSRIFPRSSARSSSSGSSS